MSALTFEHLSISQTQVCKGLAILFIVIHNVFAKLDATPLHNEFTLNSARLWKALSIVYLDPSEFIHIFMSFLGHYGVQIFTFLSAYGLMRSIETQAPTWFAFMWKRIKSLLLPMILVMAFFLLLDYSFDGIFSARAGHYDVWNVINRMLFISNIMPGEAVLVIGPWWFLSMIVQFYCVFLLLHAMQLRFGNASLVVVSLLSFMLIMEISPLLAKHQLSLMYTVVGHVAEFALGMYVGSLKKIRVPIWLLIVASLGLLLGNMFYFFWLFAPVSAIILMMTLCAVLLKYSSEKNIVIRALQYTGLLSMYIFLLNGVIREPFIPLAKAANDPYMALAYVLFATALCFVVAQLFYRFEFLLKKTYSALCQKA